MKKLSAKEISRETESKRGSPSVIAKLMGLDGLPSQQAAYMQGKSTSENYISRIRSAKKGQKNDMHSHFHSSRRSLKEEQEFKDVFEVLETSKVGSCSYSLQGAATSKCNDPEMAFIRQKFVDAKRLSTDEKLQNSKEFQDTLEVLESNKDLLIKFLQQPDMMFAKHLNDLHSANPRPRCGQITVMRSSETHKADNLHHSCKSASEVPSRNSSISPKHCDCHCCQCGSHADPCSHKSLKNQLEGNNEAAIPTRIVILKPNLGKLLSASKTISSPCSSHSSQSNCRKHKGILSTKNKGTELCERKKNRNDAGLSGHKCRESRELAKKITWQMRNSFPVGSVNFCSSASKSYAGDESSGSMSDESVNESEVMLESPRDSFNLDIRPRPSLSYSSGSSVNREAKKRLSERWRMTHKTHDFGAANRGSTLAEMLAIPDNDMRQSHLKNINDEAGLRNKVATHGRPAGFMKPFGISSRDGWNNGFMRNVTRSRSLPASSAASMSPKRIMRLETIYDDRYVIPKEISKRERKPIVKSNSGRKSVNRHMRSRDKDLCSSSATVKEFNDTSPRTHTNQNHMMAKLEVNHLSDQPIADLEAFSVNLKDKHPASENLVDMVLKNTSIPSEPTDELLPEVLSQSLVTENCQSGVEHASNPQAEEKSIGPVDCSRPLNHSEHGLASLVGSKETEQPSPVSVLEVPFVDDMSSCSDCFESLSADLQELRMQLQLLKMGSNSYTEGPMLVSSDEDVGDKLNTCSNAIGLCDADDNWELSYVVDVLIDSGLLDADADANKFMASWHSHECPVNPLIFEELEKNYYNQTSMPRSERRLLFDRINLAVMEIFHQFTKPQPWARRATTMLFTRRFKGSLQDDLQQLLASQEKNTWKKDTDTIQKVFGKESQWFDLSEDVDYISKEIERMLLDELVGEVVA